MNWYFELEYFLNIQKSQWKKELRNNFVLCYEK